MIKVSLSNKIQKQCTGNITK